MDVDFKAPHQENGAKNDEDSPQKTPTSPDETNGTTKESPKHTPRQKRGQRSRSRTPQNKSDESKTLHVNLKKIDTELNGKDLEEESEKTEEIKEKASIQSDEAKKEESFKEDTNKVKEGTTKKEKQSKKQKQENLKKEENGKKDDIQEKEETDTNKVKEVTPKKEKQSKKQKQENLKKEENGKKDDIQEKEETVNPEAVSKKETPKKEKKEKNRKQDPKQANEVESESVEMDPLVISDEPDPELQFDENSDMESGKGSPIIPRCITRRSQTRNIPTPKTPKSMDQDVDSEKTAIAQTSTELPENDTPKTESLNDSRDSTETTNLSTRAEVGSDITRMDYIETHNSSLIEDTSYLDASRERSLSETLRCLSARRPIRQAEDYRRRVLRSNQERSDLNVPYPSRRSVEQITSGVKRKSRSTTPEERKKFKMESPGFNSLFSSPLANIRNKFKADLPSSTPKLLGYKDNRSELHYNDDNNFGDNGDDEKKSWCSVM
ncbi:hypothetical protein NQ314_004570 [Rhamnusium bicolor]|uniref:Uncharacterized protein n=1 Tax=Rhamnusium bicolor TaxID=1586634 RepID=A0AAV8ZLK4_9CUCU|nr:hypothetical protein NQ314_004570 [Rhamnusium bicolor]